LENDEDKPAEEATQPTLASMPVEPLLLSRLGQLHWSLTDPVSV
jgi:hypothetical protein